MVAQFEIILIASLIAISCSLVGVFLVIRKLSMISDAISHTVLLGIVVVFLITKDIASPFMMVGAVIVGLLTVYLIETLQSTGLVSEEASVGVVFPFLFSIAIVLISRYAGSVHLDTDAVLLGEIAFAPLDRTVFLGLSVPKALVSAGVMLLVNAIVIKVFFKELKITSFDAILATTLGFSPFLMNTLLMTLVSMTSVTSFNAVGSILVIALMIGPALTANLLTHDFKKLLIYSILIAVFNVILGYQIASFFDVSIAGSMALFTGINFSLVFLFSKESGYISRKIGMRHQQAKINENVVLFYIEEHSPMHYDELRNSTRISERKLQHALSHLENRRLILRETNNFSVTDSGKLHISKVEHELFER